VIGRPQLLSWAKTATEVATGNQRSGVGPTDPGRPEVVGPTCAAFCMAARPASSVGGQAPNSCSRADRSCRERDSHSPVLKGPSECRPASVAHTGKPPERTPQPETFRQLGRICPNPDTPGDPVCYHPTVRQVGEATHCSVAARLSQRDPWLSDVGRPKLQPLRSYIITFRRLASDGRGPSWEHNGRLGQATKISLLTSTVVGRTPLGERTVGTILE